MSTSFHPDPPVHTHPHVVVVNHAVSVPTLSAFVHANGSLAMQKCCRKSTDGNRAEINLCMNTARTSRMEAVEDPYYVPRVHMTSLSPHSNIVCSDDCHIPGSSVGSPLAVPIQPLRTKCKSSCRSLQLGTNTRSIRHIREKQSLLESFLIQTTAAQTGFPDASYRPIILQYRLCIDCCNSRCTGWNFLI